MNLARLTGALAALVLLAVSVGACAEPATDDPSDRLRTAIETNWNLPTGLENVEKYTVALRLHLTPDGTVTKIDVLDAIDDPNFRTLAESARRAILVTQAQLGHLPLPEGEHHPTLIVRWPMKEICAEYGGC